MNLSQQINRLKSLVGSDESFYLVALHALIEYHMKKAFPDFQMRYGRDFSDNLYLFGKYLQAEKHQKPDPIIDTIRREHNLVQQILHDFIRLDPEEARAATSNFIRYCHYTGIAARLEAELRDLYQSLEVWEEKGCRSEDVENLREIQWQLFELKKHNKDLISRLTEYEENKERVITLEAQLRILEHRLKKTPAPGGKTGTAGASAGAGPGGATRTPAGRAAAANPAASAQDPLAQEHDKIRQELTTRLQGLEKMSRIRDYLTRLTRLTHYTRTRSDYERQLLELSPEQNQALEAIKPDQDFLIQGAAGTGKTLVLLKALQRAVGDRETGKATATCQENESPILLLSYTKTLVKYNRYLAGLLDIKSDGKDRIDTADSFIYQFLHHFYPQYEISFTILAELCRNLTMRSGGPGLSAQQLSVEIEELIYANRITEHEYCSELFPRTGIGFQLEDSKRPLVWQAKQELERQMLEQKILSRGFAHSLICAAIERDGTPAGLCFDQVFVDESQDLKPLDLWILKNTAYRSLIMAGDLDQTIYGIARPWERAGIDINNHQAVLGTNYRSTIPIISLSSGFQSALQRSETQDDLRLTGFREGPIPELFVENTEEQLLGFLYSKTEILLTHLNYEPGNINILVPTRRLVETVQEFLDNKGLPSIQYADERFEFRNTECIRVSTLHSAKGLDMPVVLLYLPSWPFGSGTNYTPDAQSRLSNNLLYVAMSRAMDILDVFITSDISQDPPFRELLAVHDSLFTKNRRMKKKEPEAQASLPF